MLNNNEAIAIIRNAAKELKATLEAIHQSSGLDAVNHVTQGDMFWNEDSGERGFENDMADLDEALRKTIPTFIGLDPNILPSVEPSVIKSTLNISQFPLHNVATDHLLNRAIAVDVVCDITGLPMPEPQEEMDFGDVADELPLGEQMKFKLQLLVQMNNACRHDMANDCVNQLFDMFEKAIVQENMNRALIRGSLNDLI